MSEARKNDAGRWPHDFERRDVCFSELGSEGQIDIWPLKEQP